MVAAHIKGNLRRYAIGAGVTGAAAVAAKSAGKQAGKASVGKSDPHYDMNRRAGESIFNTRKQKIDSSKLKRRGLREANGNKPIRYAMISTKKGSKPPPHIARAMGRFALAHKEAIEEAGSRTFGKGMGRITRLNIKPDDRIGKAMGKAASKTFRPSAKHAVVAGATAAAAGIIGKRAKSGVEQGRYEKRRSGTQKGYTDAYKKTYGRNEGIEEANVAGGVRKIAGKLKTIRARPGAQKAQSAIRWGGRGVAALDLAVLGAAGGAAGVKKLRGKKREEGITEGRIKGSGLRKVADKVGPQIQKADVGLFGISTGRAIKSKGQDVADDQQLNQSHLRRK